MSLREETRVRLNKLIDHCPEDQLKHTARIVEMALIGNLIVKALASGDPKAESAIAIGEELQEKWNYEDQRRNR